MKIIYIYAHGQKHCVNAYGRISLDRLQSATRINHSCSLPKTDNSPLEITRFAGKI